MQIGPFARIVAAFGASLSLVACGTDSVQPVPTPDDLQLTTDQVHSLDSTGLVIKASNPADGTLRSLVDSTLLVLTSGVTARRLAVTTNLTSAPLYFVGVHRVFQHAGVVSFATWSVVGFDDPAHLASLMEASGYAPSTTPLGPRSVSGTIGDGTGVVNGLLLNVGTGGAVTEWIAASGSASFTSDVPGAACPNFTGPANVTCSLETIQVRFTLVAPSGSGGASGRNASLTSAVDVPAMRLTFTF